MHPSRRLALKSLGAASLMGSMPTLATPTGGGPLNVVGFGSCGGRIVRRLAVERGGVDDADFVAADDPGVYREVPQFELLLAAPEPHISRPLVVVTAVGGRAGGEHAWRRAADWSEAEHSTVVPVLVLSSKWEGTRRSRGLDLAGRFVERFGTATLIDNQAIEDQLLSEFDEMPLLDFYDRINAHAIGRIQGIIATSRDA